MDRNPESTGSNAHGPTAGTHAVTHPLLIQFAKWPEAGRVKTRLIPALGALGAREAYLRLTRHVLANLLASGHPVEFWWDRKPDTFPSEAAGIVAELEHKNIPQHYQPAGDLGLRMLAALNDGLTRATQVIIVGSDCPSVDVGYLNQAIAALNHSDVVLGPADDGGFVLIGARRTEPRMLAGVAWGSEKVMAQSRDQFKRLHLKDHLLETRWDVDEIEDWERFLAG